MTVVTVVSMSYFENVAIANGFCSGGFRGKLHTPDFSPQLDRIYRTRSMFNTISVSVRK